MIILLALLIAIILAGVGFVIHFLWWIAIAVFVLWLIGWAIGAGEAAGSRRRWYGRW